MAPQRPYRFSQKPHDAGASIEAVEVDKEPGGMGEPRSHDPEAVRVAQVRQLWQARQLKPEDRTGNQVLIFYGWLEQHYPILLKWDKGDPYQHLKSDLHGLYKD